MNQERAKLLLVDDRPENLLALEAILEPLGPELVRANSGEEALRHLLHDEFAAILLDVQMPGLDGFQTAELIKDRERTRAVPILFLTAISKDAEHVFRGYDVGAVDYLMKPFDPQILRAKVAVFIDLWEKSAELRHRGALESQQALATLEQESERRYRSLADAVPHLVWTTDADGQTTFLNDRWYEYTGQRSGDLDGSAGAIQPDDLARALDTWRESRRSGSVFESEYRVRRADGQLRWHLARAVPVRDEDGAITGWVGTATDIEDRRAVEERQRFLAEAGWVLGSSLDYERNLAEVARLAVRRIADVCVVDLVDDGQLQRLVGEHADPGKASLVRELPQSFPPVADVVATGVPELASSVTEDAIAGAGLSESQRALVDELGLRSYICAPLLARARVLGAITFAQAESGRVDGIAQLELARQLASRAALSVDNAHLYAEAERRAQAAHVLAEVGDAVFLVDRDGVVRLWNKAAEAITSLAAANVVGRRIDEVLPGWPQVAPLIPVTGGPGELVRAETAPLDLGGRELWISGSGVGIDDGTIYAFRDLTEERALETLKAEFVATVSHELRTPLAAIYGAAQTLRRSDIELDPKVRNQLLEVIATESDRLGAIVSDLLVAGRLDADELPVSIEPLDAVELAGSVLDTARTHLPEAIDLELRAGHGIDAVAADAGQLRQVLVNLVDNAIKYSPEGGLVEVSIGNGSGAIRFAVADHGLGIPASEHRRIFEKFYRLDPGRTRGIGGTGLGLYICRELVRRMDGKIWVESKLGEGSTFVVELPAAGGRARP
ncbi:MAG: ATP-binding protein [Gaiellaceae bacterium]